MKAIATLLAVAGLAVTGCGDFKVERTTIAAAAPPRVVASDDLPPCEVAFRAGANIAAKLIWENPLTYTNSHQVQEAAWLYALPSIKASWETNKLMTNQ